MELGCAKKEEKSMHYPTPLENLQGSFHLRQSAGEGTSTNIFFI